jgi:hypothetical protein
MFIAKYILKDPGLPTVLTRACPHSKGKSRYQFKICLYSWKLIKHPVFNGFILLLIVLNTLILATDKYPTPKADLISKTNMFFLICFLIECILKLIGLEWRAYSADKFNLFDLTIVISSIIELIMS